MPTSVLVWQMSNCALWGLCECGEMITSTLKLNLLPLISICHNFGSRELSNRKQIDMSKSTLNLNLNTSKLFINYIMGLLMLQTEEKPGILRHFKGDYKGRRIADVDSKSNRSM